MKRMLGFFVGSSVGWLVNGGGEFVAGTDTRVGDGAIVGVEHAASKNK
jgi:hypothetical protein